jgi:hypothetical protein
MTRQFKTSRRTRENFAGIDPLTAWVIYAGQQRLYEIDGIDSTLVEGVRNAATQAHYFATGKSHVRVSKHQVAPDGWGYAGDVVVVGDVDRNGIIDHHDRSLMWKPGPYVLLWGHICDVVDEHNISRAHHADELVMRWGGDWDGDGVRVDIDPDEGLLDAFHFERVR